jgi:hypothetical protein
MTTVKQHYSGTDGVSVSSGNSGTEGSTAVNVTKGSGTSIVFDNDFPAVGATGVRFTSGATSASCYTNLTFSTPTIAARRLYFHFPANPSVDLQIAQVYNVSDQKCADLMLTTTGKLRIRNAAAGTSFTTTASVALNQLIRVEFRLELNSSGAGELRYYATASSTTATETKTASAQNYRGAATSFRLGNCSNISNYSFYADEDAISDTDFPIGYENVPPTVTMPAGGTGSIGVEKTLTATASDPEGGSLTYLWTFVSLPAGSTATLSNDTTLSVSFTPDHAGLYPLQLAVTDERGGTTTGTVSVFVAPEYYLIDDNGDPVSATVSVVA